MTMIVGTGHLEAGCLEAVTQAAFTEAPERPLLGGATSPICIHTKFFLEATPVEICNTQQNYSEHSNINTGKWLQRC